MRTLRLIKYIRNIFFMMALVLSAMAVEQRANIKVEGLSEELSKEVKAEFPVFLVGEEFGSITQKLEKYLSGYLERKGYFQWRLKFSELKLYETQGEVLVQVDLGTPCKINKIHFPEPTGIQGVNNTRRFSDRMQAYVESLVNSILDEDRVAESLRELRDFLSNEGYVQAQVGEVKMRYNASRTEVDLDLTIHYGKKYRFGFQGNSVFSKGDLSEIVKQKQVTDLGTDLLPSIRRQMLEKYKELAYNKTQISYEEKVKASGQHVTFYIVEGTRTEISELEIEGINAFDSALLKNQFFQGVGRLVQRGYFVEPDVEHGAKKILEYLKSQGYLSAEYLGKTIHEHEKHNRVMIKLLFVQGEQTRVDFIHLQGFTFFTPEVVLDATGLKDGGLFNPFAFEDGLEQLRTAYRNEGFLDVQYSASAKEMVNFSDYGRKASIQVKIAEGKRYRVGSIFVNGLSKTKDEVVLRDVTVKEGDWWHPLKISAIEQNLKRLGIFSEVNIIPIPAEKDDVKDMLIEVQEGRAGAIEGGPGFRSDLGLRLFAQASYNNFTGRNQTVLLSGSTNRRLSNYRFVEYDVQTAFYDPRLFSSRIGFSAGLVASKRVYFNFNSSQSQFFTSFERRFFDRLQAKLTYRLERIRQYGAAEEIDNQTLVIGTFTPSLALDTRDHPFAATKGQLTSFSIEYANPLFALREPLAEKGVGYYKLVGGTHHYFTLPFGIVWSNVFGGGYQVNLLPRKDENDVVRNPIPLIKTFRLGGYSTIRGFQEDSINYDRLAIGGSLIYLNLRTQIDLPLAGELKLCPFLDAGNLFLNNEFKGSPFFRAGAGLGLHYVTPIGPINFDYGVKLNRLPSESFGQFHFSVGVI